MFVCHPYTYSSDGRGSPSATPPNLTRKISLRSPCSWCDFGLAPVSPHSFQTGNPKVNKVFQRQLLQYWVGGHNNFPNLLTTLLLFQPTIHFGSWGQNTGSLCVKLTSFSACLLLRQLFPGCTDSWSFFFISTAELYNSLYWISRSFCWFQSQNLSWSHGAEFLSF